MFGFLRGNHGNEALELLQAPAPGSPEEWLERELRAWAYRVRGANGEVPSRQFYELAEGVHNPLRILTRRVREADEVQAPPEQLRELGDIVTRYLEQRLQRRAPRAALRGAPDVRPSHHPLIGLR